MKFRIMPLDQVGRYTLEVETKGVWLRLISDDDPFSLREYAAKYQADSEAKARWAKVQPEEFEL